MNKSRSATLALLALAVLLAALYYLWFRQRVEPTPPLAVPVTQPITQAVTPATALATMPEEGVIRHPVEVIEAERKPRPLPALAASDPRLKEDLSTLLTRKNVLTFLQLDGFVRRAVATVDNLARDHAPPAIWPVQATPGRFTTLAQQGAESINPDNAQRYTPFVRMVEAVDARLAVQLYASLYPLFQQAYEELGFPRRYFNDRLVGVIDLLLATPVQEGLVGVALVEVKGPIQSERPWVRYEFTDEKLQELKAGQKMLVRMGASNHRRLRAKLLEIRKQLTRAELPSVSR